MFTKLPLKISLTLLSFIFCFLSSYAQGLELRSPNGQLSAQVKIDSKISMNLFFNNKLVLSLNELSITYSNDRMLGKSPKILGQRTSSNNSIRKPQIPYKDAEIKDRWQQLIIQFEGDYELVLRAFDDGIAYRFVDDFETTKNVLSEKMDLEFPANTSSYFPQEETTYSHYERTYLDTVITDINEGDFCSLPVLFQTPAAKLLFTEADLLDYPGMFLEKGGADRHFEAKFAPYVLETIPMEERDPDRNEIITQTADYIAKIKGSKSYPWRVFMISDDDRTFLESNLITLLSPVSKIPEADWIKPGKVAWDWYNANNIFGVDFKAGINDATYKYYIDFASENGIEYVILDEGWTKSTTEILEDNEEMDVPGLIKYAAAKNVGIILWVLWKPLNENMDGILKLYSSWGAKGVKVDFMQRNDQYMVQSFEEVAQTAAKYNLMVDFHGAFKPAGVERAWPNIVNYEGVKGNEWNKWSADIHPDHNLTVPFIRMASGPIDFTPGSMINTHKDNYMIRFERPMSLGTRCHQLAMYVMYEAPLQMMCESPSIYRKEQESVDFITQIPTTWDETVVLEAAISDYAIIARRKGEDWYVGAMTDWTARDFSLDLSFLGDGNYQLESMADGKNADRYATDYWRAIQEEVNQNSNINIQLASGGGWVGIFKKM